MIVPFKNICLVFPLFAVLLCTISCQKQVSQPSQTQQEQVILHSKFENYIRDIDTTESVAKVLRARLKKILFNADRPGDLSEDFKGNWPSLLVYPSIREGEFRIRKLPELTERPTVSRSAFLKDHQRFLNEISSQERQDLAIFTIRITPDHQNAYIQAHVELSGILGATNSTIEWRATVDAEFSNSPTEGWRLTRLSTNDSVIAERQEAVFRDVSASTGLFLRDSKENSKYARQMVNARKMPSSGGLSLTDYNGDGATDILVTRKGRGTTLFLNDQHGGYLPAPIDAFRDTDEAAKFYLWVDLDNDGTEELVSTRFGRNQKNQFFMTMYRRKGDQLVKDEQSLHFSEQVWRRNLDFQGIVTCDVDGNGFLDLVFVGYTHLESGLQNTNFVHGTDGNRNLLFLNYGANNFTEEGLKRGLIETSYSFVAECYDFDRDGDPDLFIGNDYGQNNLYRNNGKGFFTDDTSHPFHQGRGFSMGVSMADFDNTGSYSVSLSNMYSHAGNRIVPLATNLSDNMRKTLEGYAAGNSLFEFRDGKWVETATQRRVEYAHWAWGNVFFDYDNDRDQDLYVVNGFTSHEDPESPDF